MSGGTTARGALPLLATALFALSLFVVTGSFASAHTSRDAMARTQTGITLSEGLSRDASALCHHPGRPGDPTGPAPVRDRHRTAAAGAEAPQRPLPGRRTPATPEPAAPGAVHPGASRPSTPHAPAALQVVRC
ncbi:hypothetical protein [Streptomyces poriticola]|uniref:hypothetical protein n=1 Tax=Streptomyces poriticola TaxID=3120506 RepID=UPI002FCDED5F